MTRPVHVVIVAYNAEDDLEQCLAALHFHGTISVVDNSSSPEVARVAHQHGAEYIDPGRNLGFGSGVNVVLRRVLAGAPVDVLLLNPDAVLPAAAIEVLSDRLHRPANERIGALTPSLVRADGIEQRVMWPFPTPLRAWAEAIGIRALPTRERFAIGAVLLLRWEALTGVGLFDERYFLYAEETDWQLRALALGWTAGVCRDVIGVHIGAASSRNSDTREALFHAAHETYIRKWHGRSGWFVYRLAAVTGASARVVVLRGPRRSEAARRAVLYARGPRRCAGLALNS